MSDVENVLDVLSGYISGYCDEFGVAMENVNNKIEFTGFKYVYDDISGIRLEKIH